MTLTYISCSSDFYTFYINVPLSLGCIIQKVSAEDIAIRGNGTGQEYMCPIRHFIYTFFNPVFQVSTAKNEINLFNNHILIVAPVTFAPAGAMTPSAEFLLFLDQHLKCVKQLKEKEIKEGNIRTTLALHLFKPLSGDASIIIDQHTRCHSRCQFCSETVQTGDTSIGKFFWCIQS